MSESLIENARDPRPIIILAQRLKLIHESLFSGALIPPPPMKLLLFAAATTALSVSADPVQLIVRSGTGTFNLA